MRNTQSVILTNRMFAVAVATAFGLATIASAEPVRCSHNGHYYEVVEATLSWDAARAAAEAREFDGVAGHLAVITSQAENDCICALFPENPALQLWIGGFQQGGDWAWVTGEPWTVENEEWCPGEPNDAAGEDFLGFYAGPDANHLCCWNDEDFGTTHYIVEYRAAGVPAVSQWGIVAMSLLVLTAGTVVLANRRRVSRIAG